MARKIYYAKNGRPYIKLKSGKVKFVKGRSKPKRRSTTSRKRTYKPRGVKTMARRRRYTRARKSYRRAKAGTLKILSMPNVWRGVGAGASGVAQAVVGRFMPGVNPGLGKVAFAVGGSLAFKGGAPKYMLEGILIDGIADLTAGYTNRLLGGFVGSNQKSSVGYY